MNVYPLGYIDHAVFFSLSDGDAQIRKKLVDECIRKDNVCWLSELGGEYQYAIAFRVPSIVDAHKAMQELAATVGDVFQERAHCTRISQVEFGVRSLSSVAVIAPPDYFGTTHRKVGTDEIDHQILRRRAQFPAEPLSQLAKQLKLPTSTIYYRVKRLEDEKVLCGSRFLIDPHALGLETFRVLISFRGVSPVLTDQVKQFVESHRDATHFVECLGSWDYEVQLSVPHFRSVREFTDQFCDSFGRHVLSVRTIAIFDERKVLAYPFSKKL